MSENKEKETLAAEQQAEKDDTKVDVEIQTDEPSETDESANTDESAEVETAEEPIVEEPVIEELSEEEKLNNRVAELEDKLARKAAEFENYKKRTARQYDDIRKFANEKTIADILDVVSDFDRALSHDDNNVTFESFSEGIKMIHNKLHNMIDKYDVKPIDAIGKQFDPNFHEALMQIESDEFEDGIIALEMNKGYTMGGKVIRHSRVGVAKPKQKEEEKDSEEDNNQEDNKE